MQVDLSRFQKKCSCGKEHSIIVKEIYIEPDATRHLKRMLEGYEHPVLVCDTNTFEATKDIMSGYYDDIDTVKLTYDNIHADDHYVEILDKMVDNSVDILVAVGSGTIHDLTRYIAYKREKQFISVPTAASVDGFVSSVAAMTWHGMKKTMTAVAPVCVLADTNIFAKAPMRLTASGISDLMGKYTALLDWRVCNILNGEYLCESVYDLEYEAVCEVENNLDEIKKGEPESMEKLMYALILSGLAMQMVGNSRPASGAEHHVSHLIEMCIINDNVDALHGEKVSVGLIFCLEYYEKIRKAIAEGRCKVVDGRAYETELLMDTFGAKGKYQEVLEENNPNIMEDLDLKNLENKLPLIEAELRKLPDYRELQKKLSDVGCVTTLEEIGLSADMKDKLLRLCPYVRRRLTLLRIGKNLEV